ncbi:MAG: amidohydrolase family protein [Lentisphaerae bacterium]|nr:amidohydrolase family protein [Lentisphaerota bacterium]
MSYTLKEMGQRGVPITTFPVIDAHAHFDFNENNEAGIADRLRRMDRTGIAWTIVSTGLSLGAEFKRGNDRAAALVELHPDRFGAYCHVSGNYPDIAPAEIERCFASGLFKGLKLYQTDVDFDDPRFDGIWEVVRKLRIPVLAHTWGDNLTNFDKAARTCPGIPFLAGHAGSAFAYRKYIDAALRTPNLYLDLSYSREHTNMIETMVTAVGANRVVWGSDVATFSMEHQIGKVLFADLTDDVKKQILYSNSAEIFNLKFADFTN